MATEASTRSFPLVRTSAYTRIFSAFLPTFCCLSPHGRCNSLKPRTSNTLSNCFADSTPIRCSLRARRPERLLLFASSNRCIRTHRYTSSSQEAHMVPQAAASTGKSPGGDSGRRHLHHKEHLRCRLFLCAPEALSAVGLGSAGITSHTVAHRKRRHRRCSL